ncbi:MAG TPA: putative quinol monooxygenase [Acidobacteriaceae bacterium]|nr:putative quinol monooxygenase [Acidobacteriaceae bacterium]
MISFVVRMRFSPEDREHVLNAVKHLTNASRQEPGCITYIPHEVAGDSGLLMIYEQYCDQAALEEHRRSEHFRQHAIAGLYQWMKERSVEDLIALA